MATLMVRDPFAEFGRTFRQGAAQAVRMPVNVYETESGMAIDATLPGFELEDIEATYENGRLTIRASHDVESCDDERHDHTGRRYRHREVYRRRLERSFTVGEWFDPESIEGELRNGVLHLELRRTQEASSRQIPISAE